MTKHSFLHLVLTFLLLNSVCFFSSCNEEEIESFETEVPASTHTCRMTFDVDFTGFDAQDETTRASIHGWDNGDVVYLSFTTPDNRTVGGNAIYDANNNDWTMTYTGTLSSTEQGSVKVFYYDGEVTKFNNILIIEPTVGVYADLKGSYKYSNENGVNVSASLSPQTSRIRFKGEPGKTITVSGIKSYTEYDQQSGALTATSASSSVTISTDGFTPYIYGVFADSTKPSISINSEGCIFKKDCSGSVFQVGVSGWMNVPSRVAHENWEMEDMSEAHVVLSDTDKDGVGETLIFYYDDVDHSQEGMVFRLNEENQNPGWYEYNKNITNVIFDPGFAYAKPTSTYDWFWGCSKLTSITGLKYIDTSEVTNMNLMFYECSSLTSLDLSGFNTAAVTTMSSMFFGCPGLTSLDLSGFNTSAVTSMYRMFCGCSGLTSLDLSSFNTAAVTNMGLMFYDCSSLASLDLSSFNTDAVTNMADMFRGCSSLTSLNLSSFNTAAVIHMSSMFFGCPGLTSLDLSGFNTSAVTSMYRMFCGCSGLTSLDLSSFNTDAVTNMDDMFSGCSSLTSLNLSSFNTAAVTNMGCMFFNCSSLAYLDLSGFNTAAARSLESMFNGCSSLTNLDVSNFNTAAVTDMSGMFCGCSGLTSLDLSSFNTAAVTNMDRMFMSCSSLASLDLSNFNTAAVTNMYGMFLSCSSLISLDLSNFNTTAVTNMHSMFMSCSSLATIDISNFDVSAETAINYLLWGCDNLSSINVGDNDFSANSISFTFGGVGKSLNPCNLIINSGFDKSVLGDYNGSYYYWRGGYFAEPTIQN